MCTLIPFALEYAAAAAANKLSMNDMEGRYFLSFVGQDNTAGDAQRDRA